MLRIEGWWGEKAGGSRKVLRIEGCWVQKAGGDRSLLGAQGTGYRRVLEVKGCLNRMVWPGALAQLAGTPCNKKLGSRFLCCQLAFLV